MLYKWTRALLLIAAGVSLASCGQSSTGQSLPVIADKGTSSIYGAHPPTQSMSPITSTNLVSTNPLNRYIPSTWGRIGLSVIFDGPPANFSIPALLAKTDASRFDVIWGSLIPSSWRSGTNPKILAGRFFIPELDLLSVGGHTLAWWQTNHPDWILYACNASNVPTHTPAYMHYYNADVPLDIHNPAVISYQIRQLLAPYAIAHGYNAISVDQVIWQDIMGADLGTGYYGCGTWNGNVFTRRYTGKYDPQYATDMVNWVKTTKSILRTDPVIAPKNLAFTANHPAGSIYSANETALLANVDVMATENGFTNYGYYQMASNAGLFKTTVDWMIYAQKLGTGVIVINSFHQDWTTTVTPLQLEYGIATYLMGNEQAADLFVGPATGCCTAGTPDMAYGTEQYHPEYTAPIGTPCAEYYRETNTLSPHIYYRRFTGGFVIVNSGSLPAAYEYARLPAGKIYTDLEKRPITPTMKVNSNDAYVLLTTSNGCT